MAHRGVPVDVIAVAIHMSLELLGSASWACLRGRCSHTHHRVAGDVLVCFFLALLTVHLVG